MARILITIPTWNEARVIARTLKTVHETANRLLGSHEVMIEVADNASTDGTVEVVSGWGIETGGGGIVGVFKISQKGKGLAIRRSWERHLDDADILMFMDADLAVDLEALPRLIQPLLNRVAELACGSRFVPGAMCERRASRELASRLYRLLQRVVLGLPVQDAQCGFKAMTTKAARQILPLCQETSWLFDSEMLALAQRKRLRVAEIPVQWMEQRDPGRRSALRLFKDGWGFLLSLAKIKLRLLAQ